MVTYPIQMERMFYRGPSEHLVLKGTILKTFHMSECKRALKELQRVYPRLTCTVKEDTKHELYFCSNENLEIPIYYYQRSNSRNWESVAREELKRPFLMEKELSIRAYVIDNGNEFDFILIAHHLLGDGLSLLYAYQDFLRIYFLDAKIPTSTYPPMNQEDLPKDSKQDLITRTLIRYVNRIWRKENPLYTSADYPKMFDNFQSIHSSDFVEHNLDSGSLQELYLKTHKYGITINSLLVTALLKQMNLMSLVTKPEQKIIVATNLRDKLNKSPQRTYGNYSSYVSPMLVYHNHIDFWSNAKRIHKQIQNDLSSNKKLFALHKTLSTINTSIFDGLFFDGYSDFHSPITKKVGKILRLSHKEEGFDISNLGKFTLDKNFKLTLAKDFVYLPPLATNYDLTLGVVTHANQLCLSLVFNEHTMKYEDMNLLLRNTMELLKKICKEPIKGEKNEKESESENVI